MLGNLVAMVPFALVLVALGWAIHGVLLGVGWLARRVLRRSGQAVWAPRTRPVPALFALVAVVLLVLVVLGSAFGSASIRVATSVVAIERLPPEFDGLRIVHLSDLHAASLPRQGDSLWLKVAERANQLRPDVLVFTGDYGTPGEIAAAPALLERVHARFGRFAVLGNHDYGPRERAEDNWSSPASKLALEAALRDAYRARGVRLLLNESVDLEVGQARLTLAGVGVYDPHHGFHDARPLPGSVHVLLAHSPEYWDSAVRGKQRVALTLSGHTHGGQVGLGAGDSVWSPASVMFPRWQGLHHDGAQFLYVNTGIGVYGLPVRLNMPPEVALIELRSAR